MWFDEEINLVIEADPFVNVSGTTFFSQIDNVTAHITEQPIIISLSENYAPVQSVNGQIGFVVITKESLGITGELVTSGDLSNYATIINLASTGSTLSANLALTGSTLVTNLNSLSGMVVFKTGNQTVNGIKTFTSRPLVNGTGILLNGEIPPLPLNLVYTDQDQFISGQKTFLVQPNESFWVDNQNLDSSHGWLYIDQDSTSIGYHNNTISFNDSDIQVYGITNFNDIVQFIGNGRILFIGNKDFYTQLDGDKDGIKLTTFQSPTDITIRNDSMGGEQNVVIAIRNSDNVNQMFYSEYTYSINTYDPSTNEFNEGDQIIIYSTGSANGISNSKGPYLRLGKHNIISEKPESKLGIGTLFPQEKVHISGGNLRVDGDIFANNLNSYALLIDLQTTGNNLNTKIDNLSGASVLLYGLQSINGIKRFNDQVYIKDLYVTGTQTIVNTTSTNVGSNYIILNATGGAIDAGIFINTGNNLTGVADTGAIIGYDVPANRWVFGNTSRNSDLSQLEKIAGITDITNYSGFVNNNFYPINNPSGFITGINLSNYATVGNLASTGSTLSTNLASTGSTLSTNLASTGSTLSTNLASTGSTLSTNLESTGSTLSTNLASTGSTLNIKINNLSGSSVLLYGNQTISGSKSFINRPNVNGTGFILNGDDKYYYINNNTIIAYTNTLYGINFDGSGEVKTAYTSGNVSLSGINWSIVEGLIGTETGEIISSPRSLRMRGYSASNFMSLTPLPYGLSSITFQYKAYSTDLQIPWLIQYDVNQNNIWTNIGFISGTSAIQTFNGSINQTGQIRIRITGSGGGVSTNRRINMDNFIFNPATNIIESPFPGSKFLSDTSSASFIFPLPSGNQTGFYYTFADPYDTWASNNFILSGINNVIEADGNLFTGDINGTEMKAIFVGKNDGWRII